jgi:hypothetical protein
MQLCIFFYSPEFTILHIINYFSTGFPISSRSLKIQPFVFLLQIPHRLRLFFLIFCAIYLLDFQFTPQKLRNLYFF